LLKYFIIIKRLKNKMIESTGGMLGQLAIALQELGWDRTDTLEVNIGGVSFSGINQTEGVNPKWAKPYGTTTYQDDAFIVIKNVSRKPFIPSQPNNEQV
jgi:hypothetical protein